MYAYRVAAIYHIIPLCYKGAGIGGRVSGPFSFCAAPIDVYLFLTRLFFSPKNRISNGIIRRVILSHVRFKGISSIPFFRDNCDFGKLSSQREMKELEYCNLENYMQNIKQNDRHSDILILLYCFLEDLKGKIMKN